MNCDTFPSLSELALQTLKRYKDSLGDIGDTPVELIVGILAQLDADGLAAVEDETMANKPPNTPNSFIPYTWPMWYRHCQNGVVSRLGGPMPAELPPLPGGIDHAVVPIPGVKPANYRAVYEAKLRAVHQKRQDVSNRLKQMHDQEQAKKKSREIKVLDMKIDKKAKRAGVVVADKKPWLTNTRASLLVKLGLQPQKTLLKPTTTKGRAVQRQIIRAPVRQPVKAAGDKSKQKPGSQASQQSSLVEVDLFRR